MSPARRSLSCRSVRTSCCRRATRCLWRYPWMSPMSPNRELNRSDSATNQNSTRSALRRRSTGGAWAAELIGDDLSKGPAAGQSRAPGVARPASKLLLDALAQDGRVGDEQIIADELYGVAQRAGEERPAVPVVLGHAVLDRHDGLAAHEIGVEGDELLGGAAGRGLRRKLIGAVLTQLR